MDNNYVVYHLHSDRSLLDSCTNYHDYIDKASELGMKALGFSEHGNIYNWIDKKMYCDTKGIKYLHGCEVYLTEQLYFEKDDGNGNIKKERIRDNYHTILIAKNMEGLKEINVLVGNATDKDHMYYKPRITFDEFLNISDNIIKISACLASPLNKLSEDNPYYKKLLNKYDFYEIQYHIDKEHEQINYNRKLYELSKKYNKPLIVGTDTHSLNKYKAECRNILKKAKRMAYDNEDDFDLTFKSYDELVNMFKMQNSLDMKVILDAINNTNKLADVCEDIVLDTTIKYPKMSDNDEELFKNMVLNKFKEKLDKKIIPLNKKAIYQDRIKEEVRVFKKINMCSFMSFMSDLISWCKNNKIPVGFCRGSVGGSLIAYVLDIIDLDPIYWNTVFSRFANEDREEVGDIDVDISPSQRVLVYNHIIESFGIDKSAYILAIGTISDKGTIDDIGRALSEKWKENNNGDNPYSLSNIAKIKEEYEENPEETKLKYQDIFYYFDGLKGTAISQSMHPAGIIASPITLPDNYGCFWDKDGHRILYINMEEVHDGAGLVKYDILGLKNIEIIKDTCKLIGIPYPKSNEIDWNDKEVWKHITDSPVGIFQFESKFAYDLLKKYQPRKINDLSLVNASLRPSGESYRDRLIAKEFNHNPSEIIDELLKQNNGFLVFQEDTIAFLQKICGLSGSEADNIRRAIGRKQKDRLDKAMPSILEGYCNKSNKPREEAEKEAKEFLQIIEDSANYQFGYNHSTGYSMIGYMCGYLRYYYPVEFITSYLNNANNDEDIITGTQLAKDMNILIKNPKFRYSKGNYMSDGKNKTIYKGVSSIKYLNKECANQLYDLKDNKYNNFCELLLDINNKVNINSRQVEGLIYLDYFSEFGKTKKILDTYNLFQKCHGKKQIKKDSLKDSNLDENILRKYCIKESDKIFKFDEQGMDKVIEETSNNFEDKQVPLQDKIYKEIEYLGYPITKLKKKGYYYVIEIKEYKNKKSITRYLTMYDLQTDSQVKYKLSDFRLFSENPIKENQLIQILEESKKPKKYKDEDGKWQIKKDEFNYCMDSWVCYPMSNLIK